MYTLSEQIPIIAITKKKKKKNKDKRKKLCSMNKTLVGTEESARRINWRCSVKRLFENLCKIHRKISCCSLFLMKFQALRPATLLKTDSSKGVFLWILWSFLRTPILQNICERLLLRKFDIRYIFSFLKSV